MEGRVLIADKYPKDGPFVVVGPTVWGALLAEGAVQARPDDVLRVESPDGLYWARLQPEMPRVLYFLNEQTADDEAEEGRIIEEAQAKAVRNEQARQRQWSGVVDLTFDNGVWKE